MYKKIYKLCLVMFWCICMVIFLKFKLLTYSILEVSIRMSCVYFISKHKVDHD
jgi:hypothetical protein